MKKDNDPLRLGNQLCFAVYSAAHAFNRIYKALLDPLGLTYPQYLVMMVLWEDDGLSVKEIGARLQLDSGTLTPLLKRMEKAGLLQRRRDADDERQVRIMLTDQGRALKEQAQSIPHDMLCATGQSGEDVLALKAELTLIRDRLNAAAEAASR